MSETCDCLLHAPAWLCLWAHANQKAASQTAGAWWYSALFVLLQDTANQLLQQYVSHLIETEQHMLVPLYACHMRTDMRRAAYAAYFHGLTSSEVTDCEQAYSLAQEHFSRWRQGDIADTELDIIVKQVSVFALVQVALLSLHHPCIFL